MKLRPLIQALSIAVSTAFISTPLSVAKEPQPIAVIVNIENYQVLTQEDIKNIFLGRLTEYPALQTKIDKVIVQDSMLNTAFNKLVLGISNIELRKLWSRLIFTGQVTPPSIAPDSQEVVQEVSSNPNAIGYVPLDQVTNDVRIALVIQQEFE